MGEKVRKRKKLERKRRKREKKGEKGEKRRDNEREKMFNVNYIQSVFNYQK